jgi:hypothetical protein
MQDQAASPLKCSSCGIALVIDEDNPPRDDDILCCRGCGKDFGSYLRVKEAALILAKAERDAALQDPLASIIIKAS